MRLLLTALALLAPPALGATIELWWNLTYVQANPDGLFERRVIGVNGTWPPPPLDVTTADTLVLHATNSLTEPMTLHHHGMFFNESSYYDGAAGITQCGIPPGETFTYEVAVQDFDEWGTYWVHAHASGGTVDGLRAPFVIHPQTEAHAYDDEFTIVLGDWYHAQHDALLAHFISVANPGGGEPVPDSSLIYFAQRGSYLPSTTAPNAVGINANASLPFVPGKTYRLRIVNTGAFAMFYFWIEGHDMRVIEVDGVDTQEMPVDQLSISVAQRYSVLVTARNDTEHNWAIHADMDFGMFDDPPAALNPNNTATLTYAPAAPLFPPTPATSYTVTNDSQLVPLLPMAQFGPVSNAVELGVLFDTMTDGTNRAMFNNVTFDYPIVPTIFTELSLGNDSANIAVYGPQSFLLNQGDVVQLTVTNFDAGKHPFHLHGHKFQLVRRITDFTTDDPVLNPPLIEGQANPVRRDTIMIDANGAVVLRWIADNPGVWLFHCHIEWHLEAGLAVQFIEAPLQAQAAAHPPPELAAQCAAQGVPTVGNAAGHNGTDLQGLRTGPFQQVLGWHPRGIGALAGCILSALAGMVAVAWYAYGGHISDEEVEREVRARKDAKEARRAGLIARFTGKKA